MQLDNVFGRVRVDLEHKLKSLREELRLNQSWFDEAILKGDDKGAFTYYTEVAIAASRAIAFYDVVETLFAETDSQKAEIKALYRIVERNQVRLSDLRFSIDQLHSASLRSVPA
jgi:hypothetical protein